MNWRDEDDIEDLEPEQVKQWIYSYLDITPDYHVL